MTEKGRAGRPTSPQGLERKRLGNQGEQWVADELVRKGFSIEARNLRSRWGEIDLIARKGSLVWLVEVKTRRQVGALGPEVSFRQQQRLAKQAYAWLARQPNPPDVILFTVVLVELKEGQPSFTYFEHAFDSPF